MVVSSAPISQDPSARSACNVQAPSLPELQDRISLPGVVREFMESEFPMQETGEPIGRRRHTRPGHNEVPAGEKVDSPAPNG